MNETVEKVGSLNTTTVHDLSLQYKEASKPVDRDYIHDRLRAEYMTIIATFPAAQYAVANLFAKMKETNPENELLLAVVKKSIMIRCRCKTVEALYDLEELINSAELDQHFSDIMYCLVREPVKASVSMSHEDFIRCRMSLTGGAG